MFETKGTAVPTTRLENDRVRVTEWRFAGRGDNTGWHRHDHDYLVVPLMDGVLDIALPGGGKDQAVLKQGVPYFREVGVEHDVINGNDFPYGFVEIEFLEPSKS